MKVRVKKEFKDKYTGKLHKVNDTFNVSKDRFNEIESVENGLIEEVKVEPKAQVKKAE